MFLSLRSRCLSFSCYFLSQCVCSLFLTFVFFVCLFLFFIACMCLTQTNTHSPNTSSRQALLWIQPGWMNTQPFFFFAVWDFRIGNHCLHYFYVDTFNDMNSSAYKMLNTGGCFFNRLASWLFCSYFSYHAGVRTHIHAHVLLFNNKKPLQVLKLPLPTRKIKIGYSCSLFNWSTTLVLED